jgi:hypothetical protein
MCMDRQVCADFSPAFFGMLDTDGSQDLNMKEFIQLQEILESGINIHHRDTWLLRWAKGKTPWEIGVFGFGSWEQPCTTNHEDERWEKEEEEWGDEEAKVADRNSVVINTDDFTSSSGGAGADNSTNNNSANNSDSTSPASSAETLKAAKTQVSGWFHWFTSSWVFHFLIHPFKILRYLIWKYVWRYICVGFIWGHLLAPLFGKKERWGRGRTAGQCYGRGYGIEAMSETFFYYINREVRRRNMGIHIVEGKMSLTQIRIQILNLKSESESDDPKWTAR